MYYGRPIKPCCAWDVVSSGCHHCHDFHSVVPRQYAGQMKAIIYTVQCCAVAHLVSGSVFILYVITVSILWKGTKHLNGTSPTLEWLLMFHALLGSVLLFHHRYTRSAVLPQCLVSWITCTTSVQYLVTLSMKPIFKKSLSTKTRTSMNLVWSGLFCFTYL